MARSVREDDADIIIGGKSRAVPLRLLSAEHLMACEPKRGFLWHKGQEHIPGWYWSATNGHLVTYESQTELSRLVMADFDPEVVAIREQPFRMKACDRRGNLPPHTPDFALLERDGLIRIVNVKPRAILAKPEVREALERAHEVLRRYGFATEIWSDEPGAFLDNLKFIAGYRNSMLFDGKQVATATAALVGTWTVGAAEATLRELGISQAREVLMHLLWRRCLSFDMRTIIDIDTVLEGA